MADRYYTEDISAIPFRVMRKGMSQTVPSLIAWPFAAVLRLRGLLGKPLAASDGVGFPGSETSVLHNQLPARALSRWAPFLEQLADLGFQPVQFEISDTVGAKRQASSLFINRSGTTLATLVWIRMPGANELQEHTSLEFNSYAEADPEIVTHAVRKEFMAYTELINLDYLDMLSLDIVLPVQEIYEQHLSRIEGRRVYKMAPERALQVHVERSLRRFDRLLETGVLRELSPAEVQRLRSTPVPALDN